MPRINHVRCAAPAGTIRGMHVFADPVNWDRSWSARPLAVSPSMMPENIIGHLRPLPCPPCACQPREALQPRTMPHRSIPYCTMTDHQRFLFGLGKIADQKQRRDAHRPAHFPAVVDLVFQGRIKTEKTHIQPGAPVKMPRPFLEFGSSHAAHPLQVGQ